MVMASVMTWPHHDTAQPAWRKFCMATASVMRPIPAMPLAEESR